MGRTPHTGLLVLLLAGCTLLTACDSDSSRAPATPPKATPTPIKAKPDPTSKTPTAVITKTKIRVTMRNIRLAADAYRALNDGYPKDIQVLVKEDFLAAKDAKDPWGNDYLLKGTRRKVTVVTYGADGKPGGSNADRDWDSDSLQ